MKLLPNVLITSVLMLGLSGCDNKIKADSQNTVLQQNTVLPQNAMSTDTADSQKLELLDGRFSLEVPANLQDKGGQLSGQANNMQVFANESGSENLLTLVTDADQANLEVLIEAMANQYQTRDSNANVLIKQPINFADHPGWRLDVISYTKGKPTYNSILMAIVANQLVTVQIAVVNNGIVEDGAVKNTPPMVDNVINSIVIAG